MYGTHLKWWKSWNSDEGRSGKWNPLCDMMVTVSDTANHSHMVDTCEPQSKGPRPIGTKLLMICSNGCAYRAMIPIEACHSWCFLWIRLYRGGQWTNLKTNMNILVSHFCRTMWPTISYLGQGVHCFVCCQDIYVKSPLNSHMRIVCFTFDLYGDPNLWGRICCIANWARIFWQSLDMDVFYKNKNIV